MAITPSQWSHVLTIPESYTPSAATSGQTLVITESVIAKLSAGDQATFWSNVQNGGGDVRICENSDGTSQLPVEVVSLDSAAETCVIWTRKPSYSGSGSLYLFFGKTGETQPAVTDPFGRNAVWTDYHAVLHLNDTDWMDSTGNGYDATGSASTVTTNNPFGLPWADITSNADVLTVPTGSSLNNSFLTFQAIVKIDDDTFQPSDDKGIISNRYITQGNNFFQLTNRASRTAPSLHDGSGENTAYGSSLGVGAVRWVALTTSAANVISYIDGAQSGIDTGIAGDNQLTTNLDTRIGTYFNGSAGRTIDGKIGEVRLRLDTLPPEYLDTEYANQSDPVTFYGTPTLASTGGGGTGVTAATTELFTDFSESSSATITATISASIAESFTDFAESSSASITGKVSVNVTESFINFNESSSTTITNNLVNASVTELFIDFNESSGASISGKVGVNVTESFTDFSEISSATISANISAQVTELFTDFGDVSSVNLQSSFTVEATESFDAFNDSSFLQLPVQRLQSRKVISVSARRSSKINVARRSHKIRVT